MSLNISVEILSCICFASECTEHGHQMLGSGPGGGWDPVYGSAPRLGTHWYGWTWSESFLLSVHHSYLLQTSKKRDRLLWFVDCFVYRHHWAPRKAFPVCCLWLVVWPKRIMGHFFTILVNNYPGDAADVFRCEK